MSERRTFPYAPPEVLTRIALVAGALGALWAIHETLVALDALPQESGLSPFAGRESTAIGLVALGLALAAVVGVIAVRRAPSVTATLLFIAACGGFLAVGSPWVGPGVLLGAASWLALLATPNPFQDEMDRERAERASSEAPAAEG